MSFAAELPRENASLYRAVMSRFATGVTVLSFMVGEKIAGMTANAFMSVSLNPALVMTSVRASSRFNSYVREGARFGINFLADHQRDLSAHFAGRTIDGIELPFTFHDGVPLLDRSLALICVRAVDVRPAGDHILYICEVEHMLLGLPGKPLVFFGGHYRKVEPHLSAVSWPMPDDCW